MKTLIASTPAGKNKVVGSAIAILLLFTAASQQGCATGRNGWPTLNLPTSAGWSPKWPDTVTFKMHNRDEVVCQNGRCDRYEGSEPVFTPMECYRDYYGRERCFCANDYYVPSTDPYMCVLKDRKYRDYQLRFGGYNY